MRAVRLALVSLVASVALVAQGRGGAAQAPHPAR